MSDVKMLTSNVWQWRSMKHREGTLTVNKTWWDCVTENMKISVLSGEEAHVYNK